MALNHARLPVPPRPLAVCLAIFFLRGSILRELPLFVNAPADVFRSRLAVARAAEIGWAF